MGVRYNSYVAKDGLILYVDAANTKSYPGTGTSWADLSGNGFTAVLQNSPVYSSNNSGYLSFNGTSQYARLEHNSLFHPAQITIEVFATADWGTVTGNRKFISKTEFGAYQMGLNVSGSNSIDALLYIGGTYRYLTITRTDLAPGWHHFCATYDGQIARLYVDAKEVDTYNHGSSSPITYNSNNPLMIAAEPTGSGVDGFYLPGSIASVKLYNRGLVKAEVEANFVAHRGRYGL